MNIQQLTDTVVMVSPDHFGYNPQTAATNVFQHKPSISEKEISERALGEFNNMVNTLRAHKINVLVLPSRTDIVTPDSVFPNNWFSSHEDGTLVIYPMLTPNRQSERQTDALVALLEKNDIKKPNIVDMSSDEQQGNILEGTGSMVLDRVHKVAFAMQSSRATKKEFYLWCEKLCYEGILIHGYDTLHIPIYHINIAMSIGKEFAVICLDVLTNPKEKELVQEKLISLKKNIIDISLEQMFSFCGNILQVLSTDGKQYIVMSESAYNAFTQQQKETLQKYGEIIANPLPTIESVGGGSARCMMAEIFR